MKGSLYLLPWIIWIPHHVLRAMQLACYIPSDDEWNLRRYRQCCSGLHQWSDNIYKNRKPSWAQQDCPGSAQKTRRKWSIHDVEWHVLQFSSWVVLFSSSLLFVPCLLSWNPFPMLTIIIFLSWDPSHSPYMPFNPYAILCTTTRQGVLFTYLFLVMDDYSSSRFSHICCILLLLIPLSMMFCDLPFLLSRTFYLVLSYSFTYSADLFLSI